MTRLMRKVQPHRIIPDTNILFNRDKINPANSEFEEFWKAYSKEYKLELILPEVVLEELKFQHFKEADQSNKHAASCVEKITDITKGKYRHKISEGDIKADIEAKFDKWLTAKKARKVCVPFEKIRWKELVENSIWRKPPFSFEGKEKGFRDSLIMETIVLFCRENKDAGNIIFLCNDDLLRGVLIDKLMDEKRFGAYDSLSAFESYLKLSKTEHEKKLIDTIMRNASEKFFSQGVSGSIYYQEQVHKKIKEEVKKYIETPEQAQKKEKNPLFGVLSMYQVSQPWEQVDSGMYWISNPEMKEAKGKFYTWVSRVTFVKQYRKKGNTLLTIGSIDERVLVLKFEVVWKAKIGGDARIWQTKVEKVDLADSFFEKPTEDQIRVWKLKPELNNQENRG